mgnify:CR=1 FL=1
MKTIFRVIIKDDNNRGVFASYGNISVIFQSRKTPVTKTKGDGWDYQGTNYCESTAKGLEIAEQFRVSNGLDSKNFTVLDRVTK